MSRSDGRPSTRTPALACGCLIAGLVLAGCSSVFEGDQGGGGPDSTGFEHATGAEDVVVSVDSSGGYVPVEHNLRNTAEFLLLGDARAIVTGVTTQIYPGAALLPLQTTTVSEDQIQELLAAADDAGLLGEQIEYGEPGVTDMPTTDVRITVDGQTYAHAAYALGFDDGANLGLSDAEITAREALQGFIDAAQALAGADSEQFVPTAVVAYRLSAEDAPPVEEPDLVQEPMPWPIATVPPPVAAGDLSSCVAITGQEATDLLAALQEANELTPWVIGTEPPARMAFRPLLPGDPGCED